MSFYNKEEADKRCLESLKEEVSKIKQQEKMNRYYTPEIEEFHVGFECEWSEGGRKIWTELTMELLDFVDIYEAPEDTYRVKYLDREDIESFGFIYKEMPNKGMNFIKGIYSIYYRDFDNRLIINQKNVVHDYQCNFFGYIKNKSEFKKLLKQLKIID